MLLIAAVLLAPPAPPVTAAAYSADGKFLAAGTRGMAHLFDAAGATRAELPGQAGRVTAVAFGPNTLAVASGQPGRSGSIRLYDLRDPKSPKPLGEPWVAHIDLVYALAFSPDGTSLATGGYDRTVKLWDVPPKSAPRFTLTDHSDAVNAAAFHPAGKLLATAAADRTVKVWEVTTGRRLFTLGEPTDAVSAVVWHPDGKHLLAAGADKSLRVWAITADGGTLVRSAFAHDRPVRRLAVPATGDTVWSAADDRTVKAFDPLTLAEKRALPTFPDDLLAFAVRPDGKQAAVGRYDGSLTILDLDTGKPTVALLPAKPSPPVVSSLSANAVVRSKTLHTSARGKHLDRVTQATADRPGVRVSVAGPATGGTELPLRIEVDETATVGPITITLRSPGGEATVRAWVDHFPAVAESASDPRGDAHPVTLPATVVGRLDRTGDVDAFRFTAVAGQQMAVVLTPVNPADLDAAVYLTDAAGRVIAEAADGRLGATCAIAGPYTVVVRDRQYRGGAKLGYRLHVGPLPVVTGVFPLGVTRGGTANVIVSGVNLASTKPVRVQVPADATLGSKVKVPGTDAEVTVGEHPSVVHKVGVELPVPGTADGRLARPGEQHAVRFAATKGRPLVVEVHSARLGSPLDSLVEIQDATGSPVPRAVLRGVAKVAITLRDHDAIKPGIRLDTWPGFGQDDYLFVGTELMRIKELPKGPDDDTQFYQADGRRVGFLGTTPTAHAFGTDVFKVVPEPPGTVVRPNGLPVVTLPYRNDDGGPGFGRDSWLLFTPPADGEYRAVVRDANGDGSPLHAYRLTVREPRPDFAVKLMAPVKVPAGGAATLTVTASRADGFEGPIRLGPISAGGFSAPASVIEAGQLTAVVPLTVEGKPAAGAAKLRVTAMADVGGREVSHDATATAPTVAEPVDLTAATDRREVTLKPGGEVRLTVKVTRLPGFTGRVPVEVRGLPHGVRVQNVGLNGVMLTSGVSERVIVIAAEAWVKPGVHPFAVVAKSERRSVEFAAPVVLRVE